MATESFKGREWEAFPAILAGSQRDLPGSRKSVAAAQGALKGYYLGGLVCDLEALGHGEHLKLLNWGVFDRHIAGALWQMEDPLKYQGPEEAMDIARVIHKWQEKAREDANSAGAWICGGLCRSGGCERE
ncbi:hypothetical protein [uncultured Mailhella sp.]|uniref:hypothetical protein n=1 Tax=uncultured Mailhella sp. TaxID=1981031 RepID=UPI00262E258A|nr:hypothetical protein [uncultured Mailhella sp.]